MKIGQEDIYAPLEKAIGYCFRDRQLLEVALTHRSRTNEVSSAIPDNQRFEFFGDAILQFLVSRELFLRFPELREGDLSRMRSSLVDEANLYKLALTVDLGGALRLGKGEERSGGRIKKSLLADAFEALVAAVYLDGGLQPAQRLVKRHFGALLKNMSGAAVSRDYKTELQELAQARFGSVPRYDLIDAAGPDHAREYRVAVILNGEIAGTGEGRSKKLAEQAAAAEALVFFSA
jgi:ribonuclease-3